MPLNHRLIPIIALVLFVGCASQQQARTNTSSTSGTTASDPSLKTQSQPQSFEAPAPGTRKVASKDGTFEGEIVGTPSPTSKFTSLQIGMSQRQVEDLIGTPSDIKTYVTGKAWIPFYFGKDSYRLETFYKNEGRLTFEGGGVTGTSGRLIRVTVDTTEDGYQ
jgi:hypothetical protein